MYVLAGKMITKIPPPVSKHSTPMPLTPTVHVLTTPPPPVPTSAPIERKLGPWVGFLLAALFGVTHLQFAGIFACTLAGTGPTFAHTGGAVFAFLALLAEPDAVPKAAPAPTARATAATAANAPLPLPNRCILIHSSISRRLPHA